MPKILLEIICIAGLAIAPSTSFGQFFTGNLLYEKCLFSRDVVLGYATGVVDDAVLDLFNKQIAGEVDPRMPFCIPSGALNTQVEDIVCQYLEKNPDKRHYIASQLVRVALTAAWPCQ